MNEQEPKTSEDWVEIFQEILDKRKVKSLITEADVNEACRELQNRTIEEGVPPEEIEELLKDCRFVVECQTKLGWIQSRRPTRH